MASLTSKINTSELAEETQDLPSSASRTDHILVECHDVLTAKNKRKLREQGIIIQEYVGNETYLCQYSPTNLAQLAEILPLIRNAVIYPTKLKLSDELHDLLMTKDPDNSEHSIWIHLHNIIVVGESQKVLDQVKAFAELVMQIKTDNLIIVTVQLKHIDRIAAVDGVRNIGLETTSIVFDSMAIRQINGIAQNRFATIGQESPCA